MHSLRDPSGAKIGPGSYKRYASAVNLFFGFLIAGGLWWALLRALFGCPGLMKGPWDVETLFQIKRNEQITYLATVFLLPLLSTLISRILPRPSPFAPGNHLPAPARKRIATLGYVLFLPALLYLTLMNTSLGWPMEHMDEGLRLAVASQTSLGQRLYSDIFLNYGPGYELWQTRAAFWLFGENLRGLRIMDMLLGPTGALTAYLVALICVRRRWLLVPFAFMMAAKTPFWITPRMTLPLMAFAALLLGWRNENGVKRRLLLASSGAAAALAFLYSMEGGIFTLATLATTWLCDIVGKKWARKNWEDALRDMTWIATGAGAIALPFVAWLAATGRLRVFFENVHLVSSTALIIGGKPTPLLCEPLTRFVLNPFALFDPSSAMIRLWFPVLITMACLAKSFSHIVSGAWSDEKKPFLLIALGGAFFFMVTMGRWDMDHWLKATALYWVMMLLVLDASLSKLIEMWPSIKTMRPAAIVACLGCVAAVFFTGRMLLLFATPNTAAVKFRLNAAALPRLFDNPNRADRLDTTGLPAQDREEISEVSTRIARYAKPGESVFLFDNYGSFYFFTGTLNATPYSLECYIVEESMVARAIESIERTRPRCVVARATERGIQHRPMQMGLAQYLLLNYEEAERWRDVVFLTPKASFK